MLLKLGTKVMNDGLHKHVILLFKRVANLFLVMHGPILFKRGISRVHDSIHLHLTLFWDLIKDGQLVD